MKEVLQSTMFYRLQIYHYPIFICVTFKKKYSECLTDVKDNSLLPQIPI